MPLDPAAERLLKMISAGRTADDGCRAIADRRSAFSDLMRLSGRPAALDRVHDRFVPGPDSDIPIRIYTPLGSSEAELPGMIFLHGGGLVAGDLSTHDAFCRKLSNATAHRIVAVDYRLAPEHKFPAAAVDADAACAWVIENARALGLDPSRLGIAGDSAGAALAILACLAAKSAGRSMPAFQLLLCPITDFAAATESRNLFAEGYLIDRRMIEHDLRHYLPTGNSPADPRISPLHATDLCGLPPALIHVAEFDPFRDEGEAYAERLRAAGVAASATRHRGMIHLFYALPGVLPAAEAVLQQIAAQLATMTAAAGQVGR